MEQLVTTSTVFVPTMVDHDSIVFVPAMVIHDSVYYQGTATQLAQMNLGYSSLFFCAPLVGRRDIATTSAWRMERVFLNSNSFH